MSKYVLKTDDGSFRFITANSEEDAWTKAIKEYPFTVFINCELYYTISE